MKKIIAALMSLCIFISLTLTITSAIALAPKSQEEQSLQTQTEIYLGLVSENMWQYQSHDLTEGTIVGYMIDMQLSTQSLEAENIRISESQLTAYTEGISFVENKSQYFKEMRQEQAIERNDFKIEYDLVSIDIDDQIANVRIFEHISFRYPDFPDILSEVMNDYSVEFVKVDGQWLIADVTAENDWFDESFKEIGFDAKAPEQSFAILEANAAEEYKQIEHMVNLTTQEDDAIQRAATANTLYTYNRANAAAYAYTYTTSAYNLVDPQTSAQQAIARTYWNQNFAQYGPDTDCMNFASQCMWAGFGGSNAKGGITSNVAPMDTTGSYTWYGTSRGNEYSDTITWRKCSYFRPYLTNEANSSLPDIYVDQYTLTGANGFSTITSYSTQLLGAILHVNSGGHAIIVTDVNGPARSQVLFTAHTSDRKGVKISDFWNSGTIYVMIPKSIRVYNPPDFRITATLQRPIPVNSTVNLYSSTTTNCSTIQMSVTAPNSTGTSNTTNNTTINTYRYKFTQTGLYTISTTARKTATSPAYTYIYTVRVY